MSMPSRANACVYMTGQYLNVVGSPRSPPVRLHDGKSKHAPPCLPHPPHVPLDAFCSLPVLLDVVPVHTAVRGRGKHQQTHAEHHTVSYPLNQRRRLNSRRRLSHVLRTSRALRRRTQRMARLVVVYVAYSAWARACLRSSKLCHVCGCPSAVSVGAAGGNTKRYAHHPDGSTSNNAPAKSLDGGCGFPLFRVCTQIAIEVQRLHGRALTTVSTPSSRHQPMSLPARTS